MTNKANALRAIAKIEQALADLEQSEINYDKNLSIVNAIIKAATICQEISDMEIKS